MFSKVPRLYVVAWVFNVALGLPLLLVPVAAVQAMGLAVPPGALSEYDARLTGVALIMFGFVYLETGRDLAQHRRFLVISVAAKAFAATLAAVMIALHHELAPFAGGMVADFIFAALFWRDLRRIAPAR